MLIAHVSLILIHKSTKCFDLPIVPGEEVLHHFQMSREESKRLKDIEERLLAIKEENERIQQEPIVRVS